MGCTQERKASMSDAPSPFRAFEDAARDAGFALRENAVEQLLANNEEGAPLPTPAAFVNQLLDVRFWGVMFCAFFVLLHHFLSEQTDMKLYGAKILPKVIGSEGVCAHIPC